MENGFTPSTIIIDSPEALGGVDETLNWKPRNYDGKFKGAMTLRNSLEQSRNIPTIKIAHKLGVQRILDFVQRIGLNAKLERDLSLSLGSFGISLIDILTTYGVFPNGGKRITPRSILSITDRDGNIYSLKKDDKPKEEEQEKVVENPPLVEVSNEEEKKEINPFHLNLGGDQVYDPRLAYIMTNLLRGVVLHGTGRKALKVGHFIGGKTGTTNDYVDAWFLGFTSRIVTGVWVGFDNNKTLGWGETGAKSALPIWKDFVSAAIKKYGESEFYIPPGIVNVKIDKKTGKLIDPTEANAFVETFVQGTGPNSDIDKEDRAELNGQFIEDDDYYNVR